MGSLEYSSTQITSDATNSDAPLPFGMGRTKFYSLVKSGEIRLVKFGRTSLIPDAEARRLQAALEAGEL